MSLARARAKAVHRCTVNPVIYAAKKIMRFCRFD